MHMYMYQHWCYNVFTPQTSNSDKHLIFLHNTTSESHIKVTRIEEMITNKGNKVLDCLTDSPCQHLIKCMRRVRRISILMGKCIGLNNDQNTGH